MIVNKVLPAGVHAPDSCTTHAALQQPIALPLVRIVLQHRSVVAFAAGAVNIGRPAAVGGKSMLRLNTIAVGYLGDVTIGIHCIVRFQHPFGGGSGIVYRGQIATGHFDRTWPR